MKFGVALVSIAAATGLAAPAVPAAASSTVVIAERSVDATGWRDGGRIMGERGYLLMDGSTSRVVVAVGTDRPTFEEPRASSTISRRSPNGHWTRATTHIGVPLSIDVNAAGDAVIISTGGIDGGAVIATSWPRGAQTFRSSVILSKADAPQYGTTTVAANGHGDLAVLVTPPPHAGQRALLLRKSPGEPWKRTLTIGRNRYDGALDSVDITPTGAVVGAFKQDQTLSVRTLRPDRFTFGRATEVTTWAAINDGPHSYGESYAAVKVGVNGDLATTWRYEVASPDGGGEAVHTRLNIRPAGGRPWQRQYLYGDFAVGIYAVAVDGSVIIQDDSTVRRWNRDTRQLTSRENVDFKDANERGDALVGINHGLHLWPVGETPGPEVQPPPDRTYASLLTGDDRAYLAKSADSRLPQPIYLKIRQF